MGHQQLSGCNNAIVWAKVVIFASMRLLVLSWYLLVSLRRASNYYAIIHRKMPCTQHSSRCQAMHIASEERKARQINQQITKKIVHKNNHLWNDWIAIWTLQMPIAAFYTLFSCVQPLLFQSIQKTMKISLLFRFEYFFGSSQISTKKIYRAIAKTILGSDTLGTFEWTVNTELKHSNVSWTSWTKRQRYFRLRSVRCVAVGERGGVDDRARGRMRLRRIHVDVRVWLCFGNRFSVCARQPLCWTLVHMMCLYPRIYEKLFL